MTVTVTVEDGEVCVSMTVRTRVRRIVESVNSQGGRERLEGLLATLEERVMPSLLEMMVPLPLPLPLPLASNDGHGDLEMSSKVSRMEEAILRMKEAVDGSVSEVGRGLNARLGSGRGW